MSKNSVAKKRAFFTDDDKDFLLEEFKLNPYPTDYEKETLAEFLQKPMGKITNWFKNERARQGISGQKKILKRKKIPMAIENSDKKSLVSRILQIANEVFDEPQRKRRKLRIPVRYTKSETSESQGK